MNISVLDLVAALKAAAITLSQRHAVVETDTNPVGARLLARGLRLEMLANLDMPPERLRAFSPLALVGAAITGLEERGVDYDAGHLVAAVHAMRAEDEDGPDDPFLGDYFHSLPANDRTGAYTLFNAGMIATVAHLRGRSLSQTVSDYFEEFTTMVTSVQWDDLSIPEE